MDQTTYIHFNGSVSITSSLIVLSRRIVNDQIKEQNRSIHEEKAGVQKRKAQLDAQIDQQAVANLDARTKSIANASQLVHTALLRERRQACASIRTLFGFHHTAPDQFRLRHFAFKHEWPSFFGDLSNAACSDVLGMAVHMTLTLASILHLTPPLPLIPQGSTSYIHVPRTQSSPERKIPLYLEEDNFEWVCVGIAMLNYDLAYLLAEGLHVTCAWQEMPYTWLLLHKLTTGAVPPGGDADAARQRIDTARPFNMDFAKTLNVVKRAFTVSTVSERTHARPSTGRSTTSSRRTLSTPSVPSSSGPTTTTMTTASKDRSSAEQQQQNRSSSKKDSKTVSDDWEPL